MSKRFPTVFRLCLSLVLGSLLAACDEGGPAPSAAVPMPDTRPRAVAQCNVAAADMEVHTPFVPGAPTTQQDPVGLPYTYQLYVPQNLPEGPVPLLLAIHGLLGSGSQFAAQTQWSRYADEQGFIVAFPTGPRKWDTTPDSFDVRFMRAILDEVRAGRCIDPRRIWVTGHSYGGFMAQRLACEAGDVVAAAAVVSSGDITMPVIGGPCEAGGAEPSPDYEPVPLAFWHGTSDQVIPYEQSRQSFAGWAGRYGCQPLEQKPDAAYGPLEIQGHCARPDILRREQASGAPFLLRHQTYVDHKHGYPDGCGGLGEASAQECEPDPAHWPTLEFHQAAVLDFLRANPRAGPATD